MTGGPTGYDTVSFLSDYGHADEFVGVVRAVIRSLAPQVTVLDLCHEIPPHDVRAGSLTLARSAQYLPAGIVLAVVDPGVGGSRRAVAVEVGDGSRVFLGPDNGLLASAVAMVGGAARVVELTNDKFQLPAPGPTFAGRDIFAPAAAHLASGVELTELGDPVDPHSLLPGLVPLSQQEGDRLRAEVLWVDRFGNAQLNVDPTEVDHFGDRVTVRVGETVRVARRVRAYGDLKPGEVGLLIDSYGLLTIAVDRASAAADLGLHPGDGVHLEEPR